MSSLPYHDPQTTLLLSLTAFISTLHLTTFIFNYAHVALLAPLLTGTLFGLPLAGTKLLPQSFQESVLLLGYVGLILMIYEAGLDTNIRILRARYKTSLAVAATGILSPITLSFALRPLCHAPWITVIASGIALSSTSLGTTIGVLGNVKKEWGVERTKTVLLGAAMLDDVVGLVGIGVVKGLSGGSHIHVEGIVRPIAASIGLVVFVLLVVLVSVRARKSYGENVEWPSGRWRDCWAGVCHAAVLVGLIAIAGYAGSSVLFAAFLGGAAIGWWDSTTEPKAVDSTTGSEIFNRHLRQLMDYLLIPFFFASIGFSIPLKLMFSGSVVWKGLIYTSLMFFAKFITGIWLSFSPSLDAPSPCSRGTTHQSHQSEDTPRETQAQVSRSFPPLLVGLAMVARGEIGFLIASVADAGGVYEGSREIYFITIWAIVLCTIIGPMGVGLLVVRENRRRGKLA